MGSLACESWHRALELDGLSLALESELFVDPREHRDSVADSDREFRAGVGPARGQNHFSPGVPIREF